MHSKAFLFPVLYTSYLYLLSDICHVFQDLYQKRNVFEACTRTVAYSVALGICCSGSIFLFSFSAFSVKSEFVTLGYYRGT